MIDTLDISGLALPGPDEMAHAAARERQGQLTKPPCALGRLEDLAVWFAGWRGEARPRIATAQALVFAGDHGVCARGVNPCPQEVTGQMVANFEHGGAAINQLARVADARLTVVPLQVGTPTGDFTAGPAMTEAECLSALRAGWQAVDPEADVLILGEMGIGNSTVAAALACAVLGGEAADWVGPGTGSDEAGVSLKARVVAEGVERHAGLAPMQRLAALGGREQAAICGAVLAARTHRIPVILDGFICTAAALPLFGARADALDHCIASHMSAEPGHARMLEAIGKAPLLDLGMRLGEGSGAAVALLILRAAVEAHSGMATFAEAGVSGA